MLTGPLLRIKITFTKYCLTQKLSNPLSKTVPTKCQGSGRHSEYNCLQDGANFYRSRAWRMVFTLQWHHTARDDVSNHQPRDCLHNRLFRRRSQQKHQSSASLAFARRIHRWPVNSPHKGPVTRKMFSFDDVIMICNTVICTWLYCLKRTNPSCLVRLITHKKSGSLHTHSASRTNSRAHCEKVRFTDNHIRF